MREVVFEELFKKSGGKPIGYNNTTIKLFEEIKTSDSNVRVSLELISTKSDDYIQGVCLMSMGGNFTIENRGLFQLQKEIIIWEDSFTLNEKIFVEAEIPKKSFMVLNCWKNKKIKTEHPYLMVHRGHNGAALFTNRDNDTWTFYCNDGKPDDDFDNLIFSLSIIDK